LKDENIHPSKLVGIMGAELATKVEEISLKLYEKVW
jgi:hypothetical protein